MIRLDERWLRWDLLLQFDAPPLAVVQGRFVSVELERKVWQPLGEGGWARGCSFVPGRLSPYCTEAYERAAFQDERVERTTESEETACDAARSDLERARELDAEIEASSSQIVFHLPTTQLPC